MDKIILQTEGLSVSFKDKKILEDITFSVEEGKVYSIVGKNGCGKTTLLRTISRSIRPDAGSVLLNGENIYRMSTKRIARSMAILSQSNDSMSNVTVETLVGYGRFSHRKLFADNSEDKEIVRWAMERTGVLELKDRSINTMSGGERQRAWMAMLLAQKPKLMLLDEPTTYLDIAHQLDIMELVRDLNRTEKITILMVLHDINHAARYSDELVVLDNHRIYRQGSPWMLIREGVLEEVFEVDADILTGEDERPLFFARRVNRHQGGERQ